MSKLEAVVFDLDDTLYPERSYVLSGFSAVADWAERTLAIPRATVLADLRAYFDSGVRVEEEVAIAALVAAENLDPFDTLLDHDLATVRQRRPIGG